MAVEVTKVREAFVGTGGAHNYASDIFAKATDQITVTVNGVKKILGTDYTITGLGDENGITVTGIFTLNSTVVVERDTPLLQQVDTANNSTILEDVFDDALDKSMMIDQELSARIDRAILFPDGEAGVVLPERTLRANTIMGFDELGYYAARTATAIAQFIAIPLLALLPGVVKGDPGGNIMAIGLFINAATLNIPLGTDVVRSAGYSTNGVGIADYVADAAVDAAYVAAHPRTSVISANARGFRLVTDIDVNLFQVGGVADCTLTGGGTDNYPAYLAAYNALPDQGGAIHIPFGRFRMSNRPIHTKRISLSGIGWSENPGLVNGVSYGYPVNYSGSMLIYDTNVGGAIFYAYTDNPASAVAYEFQSSTQSTVRDLMFYGGGGAGITAHGILSFATLLCQNVRCENFAGNGFAIMSDTISTDTIGSADLAMLIKCHSRFNRLHGFYFYGGNSNVMTTLGCDAALNGGVGFLDAGAFGNSYPTCHAATNNQSYGTPSGYSAAQRAKVLLDAPELSDPYAGSYYTTSQVGPHVFTASYVESGLGLKHRIISPCVILGGNLASDDDVVDTLIYAKPFTVNGRQIHNVDSFTTGVGTGFDFNNNIKINGTRIITDRQAFSGYASGGTVAGCETKINDIFNILLNHGLAG